ncbi:MAG: SCP2 sterol-binding domain-containing protein [Deltaproteobacteria bacterium]|nr:SCP2 sterol-binding domain-containing protein [Deltaproteobacteria bacterium]
MENNKNMLVDPFRSRVLFVLIMGVLLVASYFVAQWLEVRTQSEFAPPAGPAPVTMVLVFVTAYGFFSGIFLGLFQAKPLRVIYGMVAGTFGSWFNWAAIIIFLVWVVIYTVVVLLVSLFSWGFPKWTVFSDFSSLYQAFMYDGAAWVLWGGALVLGVVLIALYARTSYIGINPRLNATRLYQLLGGIALLGLAASVFAPWASLPDVFDSMPAHADLKMLEPGTYAYDLSGRKNAQWTVTATPEKLTVVRELRPADVVVKMPAEDLLALATGNKTMFDMIPGETYQFAGDEFLSSEALRLVTRYRPTMSLPFSVLLHVMMIILLGSAGVAPFLCVYETFYYDKLQAVRPIEV